MSTTINFPDNPSLNDTYTYSGVVFKFDGVAWVQDSSDEVRVEITGTDVNFNAGQVFYKTLTVNTTLTFSNVQIGVKDLEITGDFTLAIPAWLSEINGVYNGAVMNFIQIMITNDQSGLESGWVTINQAVS